MTSKQIPRIATWLLKHFGSGPNKDAVLGDLAERYMQKESTMWYWRQAMKAIPVTFFREIQGYRIVLWASTGFLVARAWGLYFASLNRATPIEPLVYTFARLTQPVVAVIVAYSNFTFGLNRVAVVNAATYALLGLIVEAIRQRYRLIQISH